MNPQLIGLYTKPDIEINYKNRLENLKKENEILNSFVGVVIDISYMELSDSEKMAMIQKLISKLGE